MTIGGIPQDDATTSCFPVISSKQNSNDVEAEGREAARAATRSRMGKGRGEGGRAP
jgi:hypothetical protein